MSNTTRSASAVESRSFRTILFVAAVVPFVLPAAAAIKLDVHIPVSTGCPQSEALRANLKLRQLSGLEVSYEEVDLFTRHSPHLTLYLADFDLEEDDEEVSPSLSPSLPLSLPGSLSPSLPGSLSPSLSAASSARSSSSDETATDSSASPAAAKKLNATKIKSFLDALAGANYTAVGSCNVTYNSLRPYTISGSYVMIDVVSDSCLRDLSDAVVDAALPFARIPATVPDWVDRLPEPERSAAIYRVQKYGSPNVGGGFEPHVTVGYDERYGWVGEKNETGASGGGCEGGDKDCRKKIMEKWSERIAGPVDGVPTARSVVKGQIERCTDFAKTVNVGRIGKGGTVLAGSVMGSWELLTVATTGVEGTIGKLSDGEDSAARAEA